MNGEYLENSEPSRAPAMMSFMCGAIVGASVALLLAPAAGDETRRRLGQTARRFSDTARETLRRGLEAVNEIKQDATSSFGSGREEYARSMESQV
jgi:gas vesicle protein